MYGEREGSFLSPSPLLSKAVETFELQDIHVNALLHQSFEILGQLKLTRDSYRSAPPDDWWRDAVCAALEVDGAALPRLQRPPVQPKGVGQH